MLGVFPDDSLVIPACGFNQQERRASFETPSHHCLPVTAVVAMVDDDGEALQKLKLAYAFQCGISLSLSSLTYLRTSAGEHRASL